MPDAEVIRVMRAFKRDLLAGERAQMAEMSRRWLAVERRLSGQMDALALAMDTVRRDGGTVGMGQLFNDMRYRQLLIELTNELERYTDYADRTITDRQRQLARLGIRHAVQAISAQGVSAGFARLPLEAVEFMVGNAGNGSPLRALLVASWPDAADGLTQALINGMALGYNPRKVARDMARGSTRSLDRMMVIARTESLRVYRHANLESYKASGVVTSYMRLATHDSRVCAACLLDEGHVYELGETMPEHPQGRCTLVPKVQGIPDPQWQKGEAWLREQPAATQRSILGKGRFEAWRNGEFDLGQLVTVRPNSVWGDSLQVTPLGQLAGMGRAAVATEMQELPRGVILETDGTLARKHLSDYERIPVTLRDAIADKGIRTYISNDRTVPDMDDMKYLKGVRPRGWDEGQSWDIVPGVYSSRNKAVIAGDGQHGSASVILHEYGHAVGDIFDYNNDLRLIGMHAEDYDFLDPYFQQGGPGGLAGRQEFFAEAFANVVLDEREALKRYGSDMVNFIAEVVLRGGKAIIE